MNSRPKRVQLEAGRCTRGRYSNLSRRQEDCCVLRGRDVNLSSMGPHSHTVGKRKELVIAAGSRIR